MAVQGKVKWFSNVKGYGFVEQEGGQDVFIHYSAIQGEGYKTLEEGDVVTFDIIQGEKGPHACSLRPFLFYGESIKTFFDFRLASRLGLTARPEGANRSFNIRGNPSF